MVGAGWAGWSHVVTWKTRMYDSSSWAWGEDEQVYTLLPLSSLDMLLKQAVVFCFSYKTSQWSFQQYFITFFLQQLKGIRSGKKPQIIKK